MGGKFILMSTVGVPNFALNERRSFGERMLLGCLRYTLPPHADNECASAHLQNMGKQQLEWCAVRPDSLIDSDKESEFTVTPSPVSTVTGGLDTSRINVARFMVQLMRTASSGTGG